MLKEAEEAEEKGWHLVRTAFRVFLLPQPVARKPWMVDSSEMPNSGALVKLIFYMDIDD